MACQAYTPTLMTIVAVAEIPLTYTWSAIWLDEILDLIKGIGVVCILLTIGITIFSTMISKNDGEEEEERRKILGGESLKEIDAPVHMDEDEL